MYCKSGCSSSTFTKEERSEINFCLNRCWFYPQLACGTFYLCQCWGWLRILKKCFNQHCKDNRTYFLLRCSAYRPVISPVNTQPSSAVSVLPDRPAAAPPPEPPNRERLIQARTISWMSPETQLGAEGVGVFTGESTAARAHIWMLTTATTHQAVTMELHVFITN